MKIPFLIKAALVMGVLVLLWRHLQPLQFVIAVVVFTFMAWLLTSSEKKTAAMYDALKKIQHRAEDSTNENDLWNIRQDLINYSSANCWHRHHWAYVHGVDAYILGKIQGMKKV